MWLLFFFLSAIIIFFFFFSPLPLFKPWKDDPSIILKKKKAIKLVTHTFLKRLDKIKVSLKRGPPPPSLVYLLTQ